jgi:hypothetical protein
MFNLGDSPTIPDQLSRLYDCAVFPDWDQRCVKIGANDQQILNLVVKKLCKVEEFFLRDFTPITTHLIHTENKSKFQLRLVPLSKQAIKERTTLFDNHSKWNSFPTSMLFSVRLMEYDYISNAYKASRLETSIVHSAYKTPEHRDWKDYSFRGRLIEPLPPPSSNKFDGVPNDLDIQLQDFICVYHVQTGGAPESSTPQDSEDSAGRVEGAKRHPRPKTQKEAITSWLKNESNNVSEPTTQLCEGYQPACTTSGVFRRPRELKLPRVNDTTGDLSLTNDRDNKRSSMIVGAVLSDQVQVCAPPLQRCSTARMKKSD